MGFRHVSVMSQVSKKKMSRVRIVTHDAETMDLRSERGVVETTNRSVRLVLIFCPLLEHLELLGSVYGLPVIMENGCGVQGFRVDLVTVITQPNDDRIGVEYDLYILRLPDVAIWPFDGE